jgi:acetylornithine deacetylase/succinyl-diaminopimelate desuccinylase-like protein
MPFDLIRAATDLIAADTVSAKGNLPVVGVVRGLCEQVGLKLEVLPAEVNGVGHANLLASFPTAAPAASEDEALLLVTHTDTVGPGPLEHWTETSPWTAKLAGDRLYGLGSADVKADMAAKLLAAERWRGRTLRRGLFILGTYGEEVGLLGAKEFVRSGRLRPRFVVCGEPSDLTVVHAHKGYMVARVRFGRIGPSRPAVRSVAFEGRSAHSSTPALGDNAIEKALRVPLEGAVAIRGGQGANSVPAGCHVSLGADPRAAQLPLDLVRSAVSRWHALIASLVPERDDRFTPAEAVSNLGSIEGSGEGVELLLDARLLPGQAPDLIAQAFAQEVESLGGSVFFERQNPAVWTDPEGPLCQAARRASSELGLPSSPVTKATNTEAAAFTGTAEAIVFGPGKSTGNAHCPNEHTLVSQLTRAVDWYDRLIGELCQ